MTKDEFARLSGKSLPAVRKLCDRGTFTVPGLGTFRATKTGPSRTAPIDIALVGSTPPSGPAQPVSADPAAVVNAARSSKLKEAKMSVEIQLLQQRLLENQTDIEMRFQASVVNELLAILDPLKQAFRKCKLTNEQKSIIDAAINESLALCKQHLNL